MLILLYLREGFAPFRSPKIPPNILIPISKISWNPPSANIALCKYHQNCPFFFLCRNSPFILSCAQSSWRWSHPFVGLKRQINFPVSNVFTSPINKFFCFGFLFSLILMAHLEIQYYLYLVEYVQCSLSPVLFISASIKWTQFSLKPHMRNVNPSLFAIKRPFATYTAAIMHPSLFDALDSLRLSLSPSPSLQQIDVFLCIVNGR